MATILCVFFSQFPHILAIELLFLTADVSLFIVWLYYFGKNFIKSLFFNKILAILKQQFHRPKTASKHEKKPGSLSWSSEVDRAQSYELNDSTVSSAEQAEQV